MEKYVLATFQSNLESPCLIVNSNVEILISSVQFSHSVMSDSLRPQLQHASLPCPSPAPGACSNSYPLSRWCHTTISSSVILFSFFPQSFPASGSFPVSQFFTSGGESIKISASVSVLPMNVQDWFPLGVPGLISLKGKGLSRVFSNTTFQKDQFFGTQCFFVCLFVCLFYGSTLKSIHV